MGGGFWEGGGAGGSGRASAARTTGLGGGGYRLGVVRGVGEPLAGLGSLGPLGCGWLLTPARRRGAARLGLRRRHRLTGGPHPHTVSGPGGAWGWFWAGGGSGATRSGGALAWWVLLVGDPRSRRSLQTPEAVWDHHAQQGSPGTRLSPRGCRSAPPDVWHPWLMQPGSEGTSATKTPIFILLDQDAVFHG